MKIQGQGFVVDERPEQPRGFVIDEPETEAFAALHYPVMDGTSLGDPIDDHSPAVQTTLRRTLDSAPEEVPLYRSKGRLVAARPGYGVDFGKSPRVEILNGDYDIPVDVAEQAIALLMKKI